MVGLLSINMKGDMGVPSVCYGPYIFEKMRKKDGTRFKRDNSCLCYILAKHKWWRGNNNNQLLSSAVKLDPLHHT